MTSLKLGKIKYEIATPCDQDWGTMTGDDKCRFCSLCEKNVYNLSNMTKLEVDALLETDKNICTKVFRRADGTILTEDCPSSLQEIKSHLMEKKFASAFLCFIAICFASLSFAGEKSRLMGKIAPVIKDVKEVKSESIETVGPEENWDYKTKKEKMPEEEHIMGFLLPVENE